jgi:hypothetical protein
MYLEERKIDVAACIIVKGRFSVIRRKASPSVKALLSEIKY